MATDAQRAQWQELHKDWVFANQKARELQNTVMAAYASGDGPTQEQLTAMTIANREADNAKLAEDLFIEKLFG